MKPAPFQMLRPRDVAEALSLLATFGDDAKVMAGCQSLGPMLNLRLATPSTIVDLSGIAELKRAHEADDAIIYGALVTHADIEDGRVPDAGENVMRRVAAGIAYRAVRNRGTIGGSLSHADPAADWVNALSTLEAQIEMASHSGRRILPLSQFLTGALSTALEAGEIVVAVKVPKVPASARFGYAKHCRKVGEFAHAVGALVVDGAAGAGRVLVGALDAPPLIITDILPLFGGSLEGDLAARFDADAIHAALNSYGLTDEVDRHIHVEMLRRAVKQVSEAPSPDLRSVA
ncbi:MAG: xanthine dehydrogenase family protein subunit M [Xanthobacter sp.]